MARGLNLLSTRRVAALKEPGRHADGGGLYLRITPSGSRSWVFMVTSGGKRAEIGLGAVNAVSLAAARDLAGQMREAAALGHSPRAVLTASKAVSQPEPLVPTFGAFADTYLDGVEAGWKNAVHRQQWRNTLRDYAGPIRDVPVDQVTTDHIEQVLRPIWLTKSETARRLRGRIERILDAAKAKGLRPRDSINPAMWQGHLAHILPAQSKLQRGHHPALPYPDAPAFFAELHARSALAARCLEFVILTAARSGEALGATWDEIDMEGRLWTVPAQRMKAGASHIVPLSTAAVDSLQQLRPVEAQASQRVFAVAGAARSNMAMAMLLRRMGRGEITVHGFRSTFRDWAGDKTQFPREVIEHALAHTIKDKAEAAYRRGTALERRRELMEVWATFLDTGISPTDAKPEE